MHRTLTVLVLLVLVGGAHAADAGACYSIPDHDARAWCLARAHKDPSRCYSVQDASKRAECLAEVRR